MSPFRRSSKRLVTGVVALGLAVGLSGCISVFPKVDPAGLYRFDGVDGVAAAPNAVAPRGGFAVLKGPTLFTRAAAGDRMLTITGAEAAYVAGARWVTPASVLFDEAVATAFDASSGPARLISRGEAGRAEAILRMEVRTFETVYVNGREAAPEVAVQARVILTRAGDRALLGERLFEARVKATENRVGPIVAAYDQAVGELLTQTVAWVDATATAAPPTAPR